MEKIKISAQTLAELLELFDGPMKDVFVKNLLIELSDDDKIKLKKAIQDTKQLLLF
jgi:hypothetical protein